MQPTSNAERTISDAELVQRIEKKLVKRYPVRMIREERFYFQVLDPAPLSPALSPRATVGRITTLSVDVERYIAVNPAPQVSWRSIGHMLRSIWKRMRGSSELLMHPGSIAINTEDRPSKEGSWERSTALTGRFGFLPLPQSLKAGEAARKQVRQVSGR
jgi:hypothetical protein